MARSTGPIIAVGAITVVNHSVVAGQPINWRVPVATGIAAGAFALAEKAWSEGAIALSWVALVSVLLVRTDPNVPAPTEAFVNWLNE